MTEVKFFVYGSFTEGYVHFDKIKNFVVAKEEGTIEGKAYRLKVGYPAVIKEGSQRISGTLLTVQSPELLFQLMDEFHGFVPHLPHQSVYLREEVEVTTAEGISRAQTYFLSLLKLPSHAQEIPDGNWQESLKKEAPLVEKLTDRQRTYIARLGAATGREIIPIDLPLYRELMNLEMIVDKGRRLALSKIGHEVFRYLN